MEHEKKKRQKKKKNKQQGKPNAGVGELMPDDNNHFNVTKQNHQNLTPQNSDVHNKTVMDSDRESDSISGAETSHTIEADKSYWLNREASLEQKIKELQEQLDLHVLREADLERKIPQSQNERNFTHHEETEFDETRILHLQTEKDSWLQKENLAAETIASLNKENARLQAQVMEVEASRNEISHQNQQLKEQVSKIQDLENSVAKNEEMKSELESARALIEKLVSENEKLVEKVNILNAELDRKSITTDSSFPIKPGNSKSGDIDETSLSSSSSSAEKLEIPKEGMVSDKIMEEPMKDEDLNRISRVSMESGEIVQISLDENDGIVPVPEKVSLTDAPLIGAPFRFISLVARYVSGADLVDKS